MKKPFHAIALILCLSTVWLNAEEPLNVTISGEAQEKAELETLMPSAEIPKASDLPFSLDGGKSALESEVNPYSPAQAAMDMPPTKIPAPILPSIPKSPYLVQALRPLPKELTEIKSWVFLVVDENNTTWYQESGEVPVPELFSWDGTNETKFVLNPNQTYISFLVLQSTDSTVITQPGESTRFLAFSRRTDTGEVVTFGNRVYEPDTARFSREAEIYLDDLAQRLAHLAQTPQWTVSVFEREGGDSTLAQGRLQTWKSYLEKELDQKFSDDRFQLIPFQEETMVQIAIVGVSTVGDIDMTGKVISLPTQMEDSTSWVRVRTEKKTIIIDLRHDRLFRPGTAYLRDDALLLIDHALVQVRDEFSKDANVKLKDKPNIVLRSYTQKPRDEKKMKESEDPQLTSLRTKVLFTLFARERFLN